MKPRTFVVYESMFGNTRTIGQCIAEGLGRVDVTSGTVDDIAPEDAARASLIVVGGPTQSYGLAKSNSRATLARSRLGKKPGLLLAGHESLRGWLERLPNGAAQVAAFDTRYDRPRWLTGSAAARIEAEIAKKGYRLIGSESFFVQGTVGPLVNGERERAVEWGLMLAAQSSDAKAHPIHVTQPDADVVVTPTLGVRGVRP